MSVVPAAQSPTAIQPLVQSPFGSKLSPRQLELQSSVLHSSGGSAAPALGLAICHDQLSQPKFPGPSPFQIFTQAYVMTAGGPGDATRFYVLYLYNQAFDLHEMGYASALAWLLLLIILVLTLSVMAGSKRFVYYEALRT